jgi:N-sulfoglucosamine sulfohydrolase
MKRLWCWMFLAFFSASSVAGGLPRPNILLLMAEDMSARVGAFGDTVAVTPHLDQLAKEGVRYPNTFTAAGVCAPSRAAHITGMHQISFGGQHMRSSSGPLGSYKAVPPPAVKAYPELLRGAGYYTWTDTKLDYQFSGPRAGTGPFTIWDEEGTGGHWRNREPGQPFYGLINFAVTHESGIFRPLGNWPNSMTHLVMQVMRSFILPSVEDDYPVAPQQVKVPPYYVDTPTVRADMARHYNNIAAMDQQVGEILAQLEADGLAESTIVIWTTDHGDGLPRAKRELFDSGIKVPMIVRWPQAYRPDGVPVNGFDSRLVSFVDLAPTLLRLAGVESPPYLQGRDIVEAQARQYIYASRDRIDEVEDRQRAVRDQRYKYIRSWYPEQPGGHHLLFRDNMEMMIEFWSLLEAGELNAEQRQWFEAPGEERLFDLASDPHELHDLADEPEYQATLERMRKALSQWQQSVGDWSEEPEAAMMARFQPEGETPVTAAPETVFQTGKMLLQSSTEGASIGYRLGEGPWKLYSGPVAVSPGVEIEAKAVRYGWEESGVTTGIAP